MCKSTSSTLINNMEQQFNSALSEVLTTKLLERQSSVVSPVPTKQVRFGDYAEIIPTPSPLDQLETVEELLRIWYSCDDLQHFRSEARETCRRMRVDDIPEKSCSLALNSETRGLEQRACLERQRRKYLGVKCVVRAQVKLDEYKLACLSYKCTHWASELALEEAARDFVRAYMEESPLKRSCSSSEQTDRVVRRKLA